MSRRQRSSLRRRLEVVLVGVALVSVLLLSAVNFVFARTLVDDGLRTKLEALRDTRVQAIERAVEREQNDVSNLGVTPTVISALSELSREYRQFDTEVDPDPDVLDALVSVYGDFLASAGRIGEDIDPRSLLPTTPAGQYVQQHYVAENPGGFDDRDLLDDAGDGSGYSEVHAEYHPVLRSLMENTRMSDMLFVDAETREIVYSTKKRIDIGTNIADGAFAAGQLGQVFDRLSGVAVGQAVISDSSFYIPARGEAVIFVASAVRSGSVVVGAVISELPVSALTSIVTADGGWQLLGLGESGDMYIVGADDTLRTDPRLWLDDPAKFLVQERERSGDQSLAEAIEAVGSAALLQSVDNDAVNVAQAGDDFVGTVNSPMNGRTLAASGALEVGDLDWVVVVEQNGDESRSSLRSLWKSTLVLVAILLPITALLGIWFARSLTRPFESLVAAAARVARGEPVTDVEDLGANEFGDVGRQLEAVAEQLAAEEQRIVAEEAHINEVLNAAMPARLVDRVRSGEQGIEDIVDTATIVSMIVDNLPGASGSDQDVVAEIVTSIGDGLEGLIERFGIDRVRRSPSGAVFALGLDEADARRAEAAEFTCAAFSVIVDVGVEFGQELTPRAGIAAGEVATGVVGTSQLSFGVWGEAVSIAFALAAVAQPGEILVDPSIADHLGDGWRIEEVTSRHGLDGYLTGYAISCPDADDDDSVPSTD